MQKTYTTSAGRIVVETGTEGPRHDPYSYTQTTVYRRGRKVASLHVGLGVVSEVAGERLRRRYREDYRARERREVVRFERACGYTLRQIDKAIERAEYRRAMRCLRETGMSPHEIAACERAAGWDPSP